MPSRHQARPDQLALPATAMVPPLDGSSMRKGISPRPGRTLPPARLPASCERAALRITLALQLHLMLRCIPPLSLLAVCAGCVPPSAGPIVPGHAATITPNLHPELESPPQQPAAAAWHILPGPPSVLVLDGRDTVRTELHDLQLITELTAPTGMVWSVMRGKGDTRGGQAAVSMYVLCTDTELSAQAIHHPWHMPGRIADGPGEECYYEAQVFVGEVLQDTVGVIWYDRSLMPDGKWKENTVLLDLSGEVPDTLVLFGHGRKSSTIHRAFNGKCELLKGLDQHIRH